MENFEQLSSLEMLLAETSSRKNILKSITQDERGEEVQKATIRYPSNDYKGKRDMPKRDTHLDHNREEGASALARNSCTTIDMAQSRKTDSKKMRVAFHNKVFFETGETEDLPGSPDESARRRSNSNREGGNLLQDPTNSGHVFPTDGKDDHEFLLEIEEVHETTTVGEVDEDVRGLEDNFTALCKQEHVQSRVLNDVFPPESSSRNSTRETGSAAVIVAENVEQAVSGEAGSKRAKLFCGIPIQLKKNPRGSSPPDTSCKILRIPKSSSSNGSNSFDIEEMGISCDLYKAKEENQGLSQSSKKQFYHVIWH